MVAERAAPSSGLWTEAATPLPERVAVGAGSALFVDGRCLLDGEPPARLELLAGGSVVTPLGWGAPPPRSRFGRDYWWALLELPAVERPERLELSLRARSAAGGERRAAIGSLQLVPGLEPPAEAASVEPPPATGAREGEALVAICMATFEPDPELLRRQVASIRAQTHGRWVCLVSDDGSSPRALARIEEVLGDDPRFTLSHAPANRGFYANFERALSMVPGEAGLVALCDQDDEWHPDKLESLIAGLAPEAGLVYSDMRIVDRSGELLSDTYWEFRRNNHTDFGSLLLANTVTGAAMLFRRELLDDVLPFPPRHRAAYHDHWIAQVAMALGPIAYVDRPLYDYVQHGGATIGHLSANGSGRFSAPLLERTRITWRRFRGRRYRLGWRQPYFNVYCRIALAALVLRARLGDRMGPERRAIVETLTDPRRARSWLLRRALGDGLATTETLGRERVMLAGLAWSEARAARRRLQALRSS